MRFAFIGLLTALVVLGGCTALDSFFGFDPANPEASDGAPSPAAGVGGALSLWFPWASAALSLVGGVYTDIRRRAFKNALQSVVRGVEAVQEAGAEGKIDLASLPEILKKIQQADGTQLTVQSILNLVKKLRA